MRELYVIKQFFIVILMGIAFQSCREESKEEIEGEKRAVSFKKPSASIGIMADVQYCDCDHYADRYYRSGLTKLPEAMANLNTFDLEYVFHLGDAIERDFSSFDSIMPLFDHSRAPVIQVLGNHDYEVDEDFLPEVPAKMMLPNNYFSVAISSGFKALILDGNEIGLMANKENSGRYNRAKEIVKKLKNEGAVNAVNFNGAVGSDQMNWVERELKSARLSGDKVLIMNHYPIFPADNIHNLWNDGELRELLQKYNDVVAVYLNGHNHGGNFGTDEFGIHYVTLHGMVEMPAENAYGVLNLYEDRLEIRGYGREQDRILIF